MSASLFLRSTRAFASQLEIGLGSLERVGHDSLSRYSIREIEAAQEGAREGRFRAERKRAAANARRDRLTAEAASWGEKAAFALGKDRAELATRAIEQQIDCEARAEAASQEAGEAEAEIARLAKLTDELGEERRRMSAELTAAERDRAGTAEDDDTITLEQRAERARARFDRMMEDVRPAAAATADGAAELDALRREDRVAERLAAMRAAAGGKRKRS